MDIVVKLIGGPMVDEAAVALGLPAGFSAVMVPLLAGCLALYLVPRTAVLGAVLMTGYLGAAVFAHARVGNPLFTHTLFPIYLASALWFSLYLRDPRVRGLLARR